MITSTITERGQTTLPKRVREALHLKGGLKLIYEIKGDAVIIRRHPGVMASYGALKNYRCESGKDWKGVRASAREEWADHVAGEGKAAE